MMVVVEERTTGAGYVTSAWGVGGGLEGEADESQEFEGKSFFLMWTILKVFVEFVTVLLLFYVFGFFFGGVVRLVGILAP